MTEEADIDAGVDLCRNATGPVLVTFKVSADPLPMVLPPKDGAYLKSRFREAVVGKI